MSNEIQSFDQFESIRKHIEPNGEIWYAIVDVIEALTGSPDAAGYWRKMKYRELKEVVPFWNDFSMRNKKNNRVYSTSCANQEGILRLIQSIPSPKAEPFRQWMAITSSRRLDEMKDNPIEVERERLRMAGLSERDIDIRLKGIEVHQALDEEWIKRGLQTEEKEILSDEIHKGTFDGLTRSDHADLKKLEDGDNLFDHMSAMEYTFRLFGEASTHDEIKAENPEGFEENLQTAQKGGETAGKMREVYEEETGRKVITDQSPINEKKSLEVKKDPEE